MLLVLFAQLELLLRQLVHEVVVDLEAIHPAVKVDLLLPITRKEVFPVCVFFFKSVPFSILLECLRHDILESQVLPVLSKQRIFGLLMDIIPVGHEI